MKKIIVLFTVLILVFSVIFVKDIKTSADTETSEGTPLVAKYDFDLDNGATVIDKTGTHHGIATGTTLVTGWDGSGKARSFNGSSDFITITDNPVNVGKKSIRLRVKTSNIENRIIMANASHSGESGIIIQTVEEGHLSFRIVRGVQSSDALNLISSNKITDNQWHEIVITFDGQEGKLYVDNMETPVAEGTIKSPEVSTKQKLFIGKTPDNKHYFDGQLDDIEIYNNVIQPFTDTPSLNSKLYVGTKSSYKLTAAGDVISWGENSYGQLGLGDTKKRVKSQKGKVNLPEKITNLVMGQNFVVALGESGKVYGWGDNASGILADEDGIIKEPVVVDEEITELIDID